MKTKTTQLPKFARIEGVALVEHVTWWRTQAQAWRAHQGFAGADQELRQTAKKGEMRCLRQAQIFQRALASHIWGR